MSVQTDPARRAVLRRFRGAGGADSPWAPRCWRRCSRPTSRSGTRPTRSRRVEHKCDFLTHEIIQRLHRTFVTPLDREDIHSLARSLDDVMDAIDASAAIVRLYQHRARASRRARAGAHHQGVRRPDGHGAEGARAAARASPSRPSRSTGSRTRPTASIRPRSAPLRGGARPDRDHQVEGDSRLPRGRHRPLRGRRQRRRRRRRQARLSRMDTNLLAVVGARARRADLRLHQRLPRRGELDRHGRLDAGPDAGQGGHLGGVLQFRRRVHVRHRRRQDGRLRAGRSSAS